MKRTNAPAILSIFLAAVLIAPAGAADHIITQTGFTFVSDDLTISVGDEVEWDWTGGSHTVTSGTGLADPDIGLFFDVPLDSANDSFSYQFDTVGDFPYFCRPHVDLGMTGIIRVTPSVPNDESTWSAVKSLYR